MRDRTDSAMLWVEVSLVVLLALLGGAGLASGIGLRMVVVGSVMVSTAGLMEFHRRDRKNSTTFRGELRKQIRELRDGLDEITKRLDAITVSNAVTQDKLSDELGAQRRDRDRT